MVREKRELMPRERRFLTHYEVTAEQWAASYQPTPAFHAMRQTERWGRRDDAVGDRSMRHQVFYISGFRAFAAAEGRSLIAIRDCRESCWRVARPLGEDIVTTHIAVRLRGASS